MKFLKSRKLSLAIGILWLMTSSVVFGAVPEDILTIFAGGNAGKTMDGNLLESGFSAPYGLTVDKNGGLIITDSNNSLIRKVMTGKVSTVAGFSDGVDEYSFPAGGYVDGPIGKAKLKKPRFSVVASDGTIYISDTGNNAVRKVSQGNVTTVAGNGKAGFKDGSHSDAMFHCPSGIAIDEKGIIYVADSLNHVIRKITEDGKVSIFAGIPGEKGGYKDGDVLTAMFNEPSDIAFDSAGALYVLDTGNQLIRKIKDGKVQTYCGNYIQPDKETGYVPGALLDGYGVDARFNFPKGLDVLSDGTLLIADTWNNVIRGVLPNKKVVTLAGTGVAGDVDGIKSLAQMNSPTDVKYLDGKLYISDMWNNTIKSMPLNMNDLQPIPTENPILKGITFGPKAKQLQLAYTGKISMISEKSILVKTEATYVSVSDFVKILGGKTSVDTKKKQIKISIKGKNYTIKMESADIQMKKTLPLMKIRSLANVLGKAAYEVPENNAFVIYER